MLSLGRLAPYLRPYWRRYTGGLLLMALGAIVGAASPPLVGAAIDRLKPGASAALIALFALAFLGVTAVRGFFVFAGRWLVIALSRTLEHDLRRDLYAHLLRLPASWFDRNPTGDVTSRFINDIEGVRMAVGVAVMYLAGTGVLAVSSLAGMLWVDWRLALICLVPLAGIALIMALAGGRLHDRSLVVQDRLGDISTRAQENFTGQRVVKAFAQEEAESARFRRECEAYLAANVSLARLRGVVWASITLMMELTIVATVAFGGRWIIQGTFTTGDLATFMLWQFMLGWPMVAIGWIITVFQRGAACWGRLRAVLDEAPAPPGVETRDLLGAIEFRNLTFRYAPDRPPALEDVSFRVEPGARVGIVGATGSGKSTIAALLLKLYPAPAGTLFLDGRDIGELSTSSVRAAIGAVHQDSHVFSESLRDNIAIGGGDGEAAPGDIEQAAALSRIARDAASFPDGLSQLVGERGVTLSGGQRQRTALARALIRRPAMLILDDALSSVDAQTEREILGDLAGVMRNRTVVVISHRMSAVADFDRILVLDAGRVVEQGPPAELIARGGAFARMCERQALLDELSRGAEEVKP